MHHQIVETPHVCIDIFEDEPTNYVAYDTSLQCLYFAGIRLYRCAVMSLSQLSQLLPLPEEDLQQVLDYAATLSKPDAVSHFSNLLGDSPLVVDFISSFNSRRKDPSPVSASTVAPGSGSGPSSSTESPDAVPKTRKGGSQNRQKKKALHMPQPRRISDHNSTTIGGGTAYHKKNNDLDYIPQHQRASASTSQHVSRAATPTTKPTAVLASQKENEQRPSSGYLISDLPSSKSKARSNPTSRTSTPKPFTAGSSTTKISISGGTPMAGQSTALTDLDAAIRALEITTNPTLDGDPKRRRCNCVATRHPLQTAAPNCVACGKVICMKEGLGPCTFCGTPLLSTADVQAMVKELKGERGRELMAADAKANRRAEVSKKPAPFSQNRAVGVSSTSSDPMLSEAQAQAMAHRDKLLGFQAQNAKRTTVRDEAADFDVGSVMSGGGGGSMWASPEERARELKRQQKLMRELEWNAKPEYEKRQQVLSIDLAGGKVIRRMAPVERPATPESDEDYSPPELKRDVLKKTAGNRGGGGGAFSGNPLLGSLIKPVFEIKGKGPELEGRASKKTGWRRVQNDLDDNEDIILDGGVYGHEVSQGTAK